MPNTQIVWAHIQVHVIINLWQLSERIHLHTINNICTNSELFQTHSTFLGWGKKTLHSPWHTYSCRISYICNNIKQVSCYFINILPYTFPLQQTTLLSMYICESSQLFLVLPKLACPLSVLLVADGLYGCVCMDFFIFYFFFFVVAFL